MKTRITELFGIEHPIIQGGMHYVGFAELAAAVSNAGGLGIITGLTQKTPDDLAREIKRCHEMTDKPFGVNLTFLPTVTAPDYPGYISAIIDGGIKIVETAGRNPQDHLPRLKEAGVKTEHINYPGMIHGFIRAIGVIDRRDGGPDQLRQFKLPRCRTDRWWRLNARLRRGLLRGSTISRTEHSTFGRGRIRAAHSSKGTNSKASSFRPKGKVSTSNTSGFSRAKTSSSRSLRAASQAP